MFDKIEVIETNTGRRYHKFTVDCNEWEEKIVRGDCFYGSYCKGLDCGKMYELHVSEEHPDGILDHAWVGKSQVVRNVDIFLPENTLCKICGQSHGIQYDSTHNFLTEINFVNMRKGDVIHVYRGGGIEVKYPYYGMSL